MLAAVVLQALEKQGWDLRRFLLAYGCFVLFINFFIYVILSLFFGKYELAFDFTSPACGSMVKFLGLSILLAILLPAVFHILRLNVRLELRIKAQGDAKPKARQDRTGKSR